MYRILESKPILGLDIGGTIEDTWSSKQNWFRRRGIDIGQSPISRKEVESILGEDKFLYQNMADEVYSEEGIMSHQLVINSKKSIEKIHRYYEIILLSTRPENKMKVTERWLDSFGILGFISDVLFIDEIRRIERSKLEVCNYIGGAVIVDDDIRHLKPVGKYPNIQKYFFTDRNFSIPGIHTFEGWDKLPELLERSLFVFADGNKYS